MMPDYEIVTEASFIIENKDSLEEAVAHVHDGMNAVLETRGGEMIDSKLCVESCPHCDNDNIRAAFVAGAALVGVELSTTIFDAEDEEYAKQVMEATIDGMLEERNPTFDHILVEEVDDAEPTSPE